MLSIEKNFALNGGRKKPQRDKERIKNLCVFVVFWFSILNQRLLENRTVSLVDRAASSLPHQTCNLCNHW
jgi:hypothetical protein